MAHDRHQHRPPVVARRGRRLLARLLAPALAAALAAAASGGVPTSAHAAAASEASALAWGYNGAGQLGDGTTTSRTVAGPVSSGGGMVQVAAGDNHSLALLWNGEVRAWGNNSYNQLGDGTTTLRTTPVPVSGLPGASGLRMVQVAAGSYSSAALRSDGTVWTWGYNALGQLGNNTTVDRSTPGQVLNLAQVTQMDLSFDHGVAARSDGTVWSWGYNFFGELGDGTTTNRLTPVKVPGLTGVVQVAAGTDYTLALRSDGTVWAWGLNAFGQLGDGTTTTQSSPVQVTGLSKVVQVSAGSRHSMAVRSDGSVWTWGYNAYSELGDGTTDNRSTPWQVSGLSGVTQVSAGTFYSAALRSDGTVWTWGYNAYGQLGNGTTTASSTPVPANAGGIIQISVNSGHTLAVQAAKPVNLTLPAVSGKAANGSLLTASRGTWSGVSPISYSYRWQRCTADTTSCVDIPGATATTYRAAHADIGSRIRVRITADNVGGTSAPVASAATAVVVKAPPVNTKAPTVTGTKTRGKVLTAHAGTWTGAAPIRYAYQWQRCNAKGTGCANIRGATRTTYRLASADVGKRIRLNVTATNPDGHATAHSAVTATIKK
ncbi:hypothetical protein ACIQFZ_29230 [Streptomyces sp. NPDC093064]|uniref:RCC1 domain-containing protein n=1 Tax=Streptomyces sp. NPDC093064 TaxID=3366020 RepID=UPI0038035536